MEFIMFSACCFWHLRHYLVTLLTKTRSLSLEKEGNKSAQDVKLSSSLLFEDELLRTLASLGEEVRSCTSRFDDIKTRLCQVRKIPQRFYLYSYGRLFA